MLPMKASSSRLSNSLACAVALTLAASATAHGSSYTVIYDLYGSSIGSIAGDIAGDGRGHIYGTGIGLGPGVSSGGVVFQLTPPAAGKSAWTYMIDGFDPGGPQGVVVDAGVTFVSGVALGVDTQGGAYGFGTVFSIGFLGSPVLHRFWRPIG